MTHTPPDDLKKSIDEALDQLDLKLIRWLSRCLGWISLGITIFGLPALIAGYVQLFGAPDPAHPVDPQTPRLFGHTPQFWLIVTTPIVFMFIGFLVTLTYSMRFSKAKTPAIQRLRRIQHGTREVEWVSSREPQRRAMDCLAQLYGYSITEYSVSYTIKEDDGSADSEYGVTLHCMSRNLGIWRRRTRSTAGPEPSQKPYTKRSNAVGDIDVVNDAIVKDNEVVDQFRFRPSLDASDGPVKLSFRRSSKPATFKTARTGRDGEVDYISFQPFDPIQSLELTVDFDGFEPDDVWATAHYGPAEQQLSVETLAVYWQLKQTTPRPGSRLAKLVLRYPLVGVTYRINWKVKNETGPASSGD